MRRRILDFSDLRPCLYRRELALLGGLALSAEVKLHFFYIRRASPPLTCQGAFYALRPEDLRRGVSFPVGVAAWIYPKLCYFAHWRNKMQVLTHSSFDLCASRAHQTSTLAYTPGTTGAPPAYTPGTTGAPWLTCSRLTANSNVKTVESNDVTRFYQPTLEG